MSDKVWCYRCRKAHTKGCPKKPKRKAWPDRDKRRKNDRARRKLKIGRTSRCSICGAMDSLERDHIVPLAEGGSDTISNLQILCKGCHRTKTLAEIKRGQQRARDKLDCPS